MVSFFFVKVGKGTKKTIPEFFLPGNKETYSGNQDLFLAPRKQLFMATLKYILAPRNHFWLPSKWLLTPIKCFMTQWKCSCAPRKPFLSLSKHCLSLRKPFLVAKAQSLANKICSLLSRFYKNQSKLAKTKPRLVDSFLLFLLWLYLFSMLCTSRNMSKLQTNKKHHILNQSLGLNILYVFFSDRKPLFELIKSWQNSRKWH